MYNIPEEIYDLPYDVEDLHHAVAELRSELERQRHEIAGIKRAIMAQSPAAPKRRVKAKTA